MSRKRNRFITLAGMTAGIASKTISHQVKQIGASEQEKIAAKSELLKQVGLQIADTLGEMKGAVMKVGQIASQYKDIFPPEVAQSLQKLQREAPPMAFSTIQKQIEKELGAPLEKCFKTFDKSAFAAASIGQVHRATLPTGEAVVVKVQYPDIDKSVESDLKQVRLALKLTGLLKIDKQLQRAIFDEIKTSLFDELDYTKEAHNLTVFKTFHAPIDSGLIIPKVYPELSSQRVLTLSEEKGESLETASQWDDAVKTTIANRLFDFSASQLFHLHRIHCDPHPGNFAFRSNGEVVVYDFGGIKSYQDQQIDIFKSLLNHALSANITALEHNLIQLGIRVNNDKEITPDFYQSWLDILTEPLTEPFDFKDSDVHFKVMKQLKRSLQYWDYFKPSPTVMMVNRTVSGMYWNIVSLKAKADFRSKTRYYAKS